MLAGIGRGRPAPEMRNGGWIVPAAAQGVEQGMGAARKPVGKCPGRLTAHGCFKVVV